LLAVSENAMKRLICAGGFGFAILFAACGGDDDVAAPAEPTKATASSPAATAAEPGVARGTLGAGAVVRSLDGKLEVRGTAPLEITLKVTEVSPPKGWAFITPVFDISVKDGGKPVTSPSSALELSFKVPGGAATVMYHDGKEWVILDSESDGRGSLSAKATHLSAFAAARPAAGTVTRVSATATATSSVPTAVKATPTSIATKPAMSVTPEPSPSPSPTARASTAAGDPTTLLFNAAARFKGKGAPVSGGTNYSGSGSVPLPPNIETAMASVATQGELFYGLYSAVNEVVTAGATIGAPGTFSLLVEPRTTFPGNTTDAQAELAAIFPGATGLKYAPSVANANAYTFYATSGPSIFVLGYINYQGLAIAFMSSGSGAYYGLAFGTGTLQ
jgi:hypothetical protein